MRHFPIDNSDNKNLAQLKPEAWMVDVFARLIFAEKSLESSMKKYAETCKCATCKPAFIFDIDSVKF